METHVKLLPILVLYPTGEEEDTVRETTVMDVFIMKILAIVHSPTFIEAQILTAQHKLHPQPVSSLKETSIQYNTPPTNLLLAV